MTRVSPFLVIFLFLLVYYPPLAPINTIHLVGIFSWVFLLFRFRGSLRAMHEWRVLLTLGIFAFLFLYMLVVITFNGAKLLSISNSFIMLFDVCPAILVVLVYAESKRYGLMEIVDHFLVIAALQGLFALGMFLHRPFQEAYVNNLISLGYPQSLYELSQFRMYGLSASLSFSTPIFQSTMAALALYLAFSRRVLYFFFFPLLAFSAVLNSRTSIVVMLIGCGLSYAMLPFARVSRFLNVGVLSAACAAGLAITAISIRTHAPGSFGFINEGVEELWQFILGKGQNSGYFFRYIMSSERYILPSGPYFWIGTGTTSLTEFGLQSDLGWVNDFWHGGFLYVSLLYTFFFLCLLAISRGHGASPKMSTFLSIYFAAIFAVCNFKGIIFSANEVSITVLILFLVTRPGAGLKFAMRSPTTEIKYIALRAARQKDTLAQ